MGLTEEDIRTRAYILWEKAGQPAGQMDNFWYMAEKELIEERQVQGEAPIWMQDLAAN
ncbi:hypothetical protein ACVWZ4_004373 [Bradyrhizobium sp. USDA 4472]